MPTLPPDTYWFAGASPHSTYEGLWSHQLSPAGREPHGGGSATGVLGASRGGSVLSGGPAAPLSLPRPVSVCSDLAESVDSFSIGAPSTVSSVKSSKSTGIVTYTQIPIVNGGMIEMLKWMEMLSCIPVQSVNPCCSERLYLNIRMIFTVDIASRRSCCSTHEHRIVRSDFWDSSVYVRFRLLHILVRQRVLSLEEYDRSILN